MPQRKFNTILAIEIALILVVSALTYLPNLLQATVYRDDWYYVLDRQIGGPGAFEEMFKIDRPARGPFFEAYYRLFGVEPLPYHLGSYFWRLVSGLAALWLFKLLWPKQRHAALFAALLFMLFPIYSRWMEGFEDQPRIASVCLQTLSIALTLQAIHTTRLIAKILAWIGSILTGWAYLLLLDFAMGMEVFRLLCVFVYIGQNLQVDSFLKRWILTIRTWIIAALIPAGFLFWRIFIFQNERQQTDIGRQLGVLLESPLTTAATWLIRLFQSTADVTFLGWFAFKDFFGLDLREMLMGGFLAVLALVSVYLASFLLDKQTWDDPTSSVPSSLWWVEALWVGLTGVVIGLLPVIMANRSVNLGNLSHYALPASLAAAVFLIGLVYSAKSRQVSLGFVLALTGMAVLAQYSISTQIVAEQKTISAFWHQMAWRAPGIRSGATLLVNYPGFSYREDPDAVSGPANFIYFPAQTGQIPALYPIAALSQMSYTTRDILLGGVVNSGYRTHTEVLNYDNLLVISQPARGACVHVIDSQWPLLSADDPDQILLMAPRSKIENVLLAQDPPQLKASIFGPEPAHGWCYYFQKADLALQTQDWQKIVKLGQETNQADLRPVDLVEWMPFLQAYAAVGDGQAFRATAHKMERSPFVKLQACNILTTMQTSGYTFTPEIQTAIEAQLCGKE